MNELYHAILQNRVIVQQSELTDDYLIYRPKSDDDEAGVPMYCPYDSEDKGCGSWCPLFNIGLQDEHLIVKIGCASPYSKTYDVKEVLHINKDV